MMDPRKRKTIQILLSRSKPEKLSRIVTVKMSLSVVGAVKLVAPNGISSFVRQAVQRALEEIVDGK